MVNEELRNILEFIGENVKSKRLSLKMNSNVFFDILKTKDAKFKEFKDKVNTDWKDFKSKDEKRIIHKTYSTFFYQHFHNYFEYFMQNFCGFDINSLDLITKEKISDEILFFEYNYLISPEEQKYFNEFANSSHDYNDGITSPFGYLYLIVAILGVILRKLLQEKFYVILDGVVVKNGDLHNKINFLIVIKNSHDEMFEKYYFMFLYYFLKHFKGIPDDYYNKLLEGRERLYQIAIDEYSFAKEKLIDLLYYFYKKCNLLHNFSPLLDFLNFVCSRVEDSVYSKVDIIKRDFLANFNYSEDKKNSLIRIFDFLDKKSTLYSTFQANNLPSSKSQFNLFLLYMKYFFGGGSLEALEVGDLLLLPKKFKDKLNFYNKTTDNTINANLINNIQKFIDFFSIISNFDNFDLFFEKVFNKQINLLNYEFFKTFLRSLNLNLLMFIENENRIISENPENTPFSFKTIIDHICRILYTLIDKIFIRTKPNQASKNFIDPRSRYIGKNIALRVLELFIFQDLNVSDDVWPDYIISMNKNYLLEELKPYNVNIPNRYFYDFTDIARFVITYNFQSYSDQTLFEEWLIDEIIIPLNNFISKISSMIKNPKNKIEIYEILSEYMLKDIPKENNEIVQEFKSICQHLALFWEKR